MVIPFWLLQHWFEGIELRMIGVIGSEKMIKKDNSKLIIKLNNISTRIFNTFILEKIRSIKKIIANSVIT